MQRSDIGNSVRSQPSLTGVNRLKPGLGEGGGGGGGGNRRGASCNAAAINRLI